MRLPSTWRRWHVVLERNAPHPHWPRGLARAVVAALLLATVVPAVLVSTPSALAQCWGYCENDPSGADWRDRQSWDGYATELRDELRELRQDLRRGDLNEFRDDLEDLLDDLRRSDRREVRDEIRALRRALHRGDIEALRDGLRDLRRELRDEMRGGRDRDRDRDRRGNRESSESRSSSWNRESSGSRSSSSWNRTSSGGCPTGWRLVSSSHDTVTCAQGWR